MSTSISQLMKGMGAAHSEGSTSASKMMPFGTKTEMVEIVPLQSVILEYSEQDGAYFKVITIDKELEVDKEYIVNWNGTNYICTAVYGGNDGCMLADNLDFKSATFMLNRIPNDLADGFGGNFIIGSSTGLNSVTVAVYEEWEVVTPLNSKFAGLVINDNDGEITANMTFEQFKEWFGSGGYPNIVLITNDGDEKKVWQLVGYYDHSKTENPSYSFSFFTYHGTEEYTYYIWDENGLSQGVS